VGCKDEVDEEPEAGVEDEEEHGRRLIVAGLRGIAAEFGLSAPHRLARAADQTNRPIAESLALIRAIHAANLGLLRSLHLKAWGHVGVHEDARSYGVDTWVNRRVEHLAPARAR